MPIWHTCFFICSDDLGLVAEYLFEGETLDSAFLT